MKKEPNSTANTIERITNILKGMNERLCFIEDRLDVLERQETHRAHGDQYVLDLERRIGELERQQCRKGEEFTLGSEKR